MADQIVSSQVEGFGGEFAARMRGHKVAGGVSEANLGVTVANVGCASAGYFTMRFVKRVLCKNTKFADFSVLGFLKTEVKRGV